MYILQEKFSDAVDIYNKIERTIGVSEEITRQKQLIYLKQNKLEKAIEEDIDTIKTENLYAFDGVSAYSLGQGQ